MGYFWSFVNYLDIGRASAQKIKSYIQDFCQQTAVLIIFTEEILNGKLLFCKKGVLKNFTNFTGKHLC